jgi:hypothetical protein
MTTKAEAPNAVFIGLVINENDLIMKAIDIEPQAFKDLVYDTVRRKTIPRGAEIIYSHIVFDKKYKIDPETKRNVFLKWKARLVFDGSKQKSYEDTFSPTPSLPMIRTLLAECCTTEWEVRHKDLGNAFCATPLEGRSLREAVGTPDKAYSLQEMQQERL